MSAVKYYLVTVLLFLLAKHYVGMFKAQFPLSKDKTFPRLVLGTLPTLNEFTFCAWIRLFERSVRIPHVFSYATSSHHDEIAVYLKKTDDPKCMLSAVQVKGKFVRYNCCFFNWTSVSWNHICTSWFGPDGSTNYYLNGRECSTNESVSISSGTTVLGGGVALLGQDQDAQGVNFDENEAWAGDISGVNLWREVLNETQIQEAGKCDSKRKPGTVISWSKTPMTAYDGVVIRKTELCEL